ncbi:hypothetical protein DRN98_05585 [Methanosarcinales archaeon]|uniref:GTP:adenosylcobinamide-phosphate guanylyltransferase n=1 Tax=Candidatus Syntropharchaeum caldarium TaxID=1838285 RepID=A0A1F2PBA4_9EURY|nr:MAG: GTP:adenosylcobinamide-phosphate guanylyltransferase [Candidatus Syntrophoarchaeum caldarius]RLG32220.1 MAG: hypothetical protein DRN98_05585 [Methanosarcinales archaeon]
MIAVVMAGGKATRLGCVEKPMVKLGGIPLIDHVMRPLIELDIETIVAVSKNTQDTTVYCQRSNYEVVMTSGNDYHEDLFHLTEQFGAILTIVSDIPFLTPAHIKAILKADRMRDSVVGCTMVHDVITPFGLNIVDGTTDRYLLFDDYYVGININSQEDLDLAEKISGEVDYNRTVGSKLLEKI